ncbi:hypothetical protein WN944_012811 [Citrus x changshan-huyou]|uniref:Uncharacterized protein n=1 Tax=Citrus x changshan-huyou TaxID=2935761 RepID=A0AAP0QHE7_9ROSI
MINLISGGIQLCHLLLAASITNLLLQIPLLLWLINRVFCRYILAVHKTRIPPEIGIFIYLI